MVYIDLFVFWLQVQTILRTIIRDEMVAGHKKKHEEIPPVTDPSAGGAAGQDKQNAGQDMQAKQIIDMVIEAVNVISKRLNSLAHLDGSESKVRNCGYLLTVEWYYNDFVYVPGQYFGCSCQ